MKKTEKTKRMKIFNKTILDFINENCKKIKSPYGNYSNYFLDTKYGQLKIIPSLGLDSQIYTVFTCFEDVDKAKKHTSCNPYSGKWNFHEFVERDPNEFAEIVIDTMKRIIINP